MIALVIALNTHPAGICTLTNHSSIGNIPHVLRSASHQVFRAGSTGGSTLGTALQGNFAGKVL